LSIEPKRGCGFRKVGGLYLVSDGPGVVCDRLPIPLEVCPTCGHGIKQSRGWTWVDTAALVGGVHPQCEDDFACPLCMAPHELGRSGLLWIGEKFYGAPREFDAEGNVLGFSRRISAVPRGFKVGETWILLAHPKTIETFVDVEVDQGLQGEFPVTAIEKKRSGFRPGIFKVWRPRRIEKILLESQRGSAEEKDCLEKGITPVFVPDDDRDHRGSVYDDDDDEDKQAAA
jgi:hypothetical protein